MAKRKIKTYEQLIKENKAAIMNNQKLMNVIYDRIDRKHQKLLRHNSHTIKRVLFRLFFYCSKASAANLPMTASSIGGL